MNAERNDMYDEIYRTCPKAKRIFNDNQENIIYYLLGKEIPGFNEDEMFKVWNITGKRICSMYRSITMDRMGVG